MDGFSVDKSFYDISASDLKELWDSDMEPTLADFKLTDDEWNPGGFLPPKSHVVIRDRLMTDAVLGDTPIKSEHSYCSLSNQNDGLRSRGIMIKDELDDDSLNPEEDQKPEIIRGSSPIPLIVVKSEPLSHPPSPSSECSHSPPPTKIRPVFYADIKTEPKTHATSILKPTTLLIKTRTNPVKRKQSALSNGCDDAKGEASTSGFPWPPTPPSSTSSDSEGNVSPLHPSSASPQLLVTSVSTIRQSIQTSLISSQPKGSTGNLLLTDEEKRTLIAEGYPIPMRLPLTKAEEKTLKKVRRKIKNKISAQESRRKKKEYMDTLERRVQLLASENTDFRKKISSLEEMNSSLLNQLSRLQRIISKSQISVDHSVHLN